MKNLLLFILLFIGVQAFAQTTVSGKVVDQDNGEPLIGAAVLAKGTTVGTITDFDGNFNLNVPQGAEAISIQYVGYAPITLSVNDGPNFGNVGMGLDALSLGEIVVTGVVDIVRDRRTPVAVSTITTAEIQAKGGNTEFPDLMKSTPSIYVANQAGGYGDSEVFTRGFDQRNTAFLLNGQPINGMEDGRMYWSNWSGMTDVATAVQVQRGLGASKLAISSVGGTVNIVMKPTEQEQGGSVQYLYGNGNYNKVTGMYNTGMINGKFGVSVLATYWQGNGWAEGTKGKGQNYFISAGWKPNSKNTFSFLLTGAPQYHDQNYSKRISAYYQGRPQDNDDNLNYQFNSNYGTLGGEYLSLRRNYYHKPVANINWDLNINEKSSLSTVVYGSWGRGGGSGDIGNRDNRFFTDDGYIDWDRVVAANQAANGDAEWVMRNSVNNHSWYGVVSNYETKLSDFTTFSLGADLRHYKGSHFRELRDLLGAPAYTQRANARFPEREVTNTFDANPWSALSNYADAQDQIAYSNNETINYQGVFSQLEFDWDQITFFVQGALSNQSNTRYELFNQTEENEESEKVSNIGYNIKSGFSYSFDDHNTVFANTGYYSRQPFQDNIFLNFSNNINPVSNNEKIFGLEAGYKYSRNKFALNLNAYRTLWTDRTNTESLDPGTVLPNGETLQGEGFLNTLQDQLHQGIELDFAYDLNDDFTLKGFGSIGDWVYDGTLNSQIYDQDRNLLYEEEGTDVDGVKVGGSAQTSFGLGLDYKGIKNLKFDADYFYYSNFYSRINVSPETLELPSYGLFDFGLSYNIPLQSGNLLTFRGNIYNAFGTKYISRATSAIQASSVESENWKGINKDNFVTFGTTQTWNISAKYSF